MTNAAGQSSKTGTRARCVSTVAGTTIEWALAAPSASANCPSGTMTMGGVMRPRKEELELLVMTQLAL